MIFIDCSTGISGDMLISALLDLGAREDSLERVSRVIEEVTGKRGRWEVREIDRNGIASKKLDFHPHEDFRHSSAGKLGDHLKSCLQKLELSEDYASIASRAMETLISSEEEVHRKRRENLELHELGSIDTLFDILAFPHLSQDLGLKGQKVYSTPVNLGRGRVKFAHGEMNVPAPITQKIITSFEIPVTQRYRGELATPTGIALLASLSPLFKREMDSPFKITKTGFGAGSQEIKETPNILRISVGEEEEDRERENVTLLETNVDDCTGEVLGYLVGSLMERGALDVQLIPSLTKKNRPSHIISVLCREDKEEELTSMLFRETGTLGVRVEKKQMREIKKREKREIKVKIRGRSRKAKIKISRDRVGRVSYLKPEYDDCSAIARELGIPLREVMEKITATAWQTFS